MTAKPPEEHAASLTRSVDQLRLEQRLSAGDMARRPAAADGAYTKTAASGRRGATARRTVQDISLNGFMTTQNRTTKRLPMPDSGTSPDPARRAPGEHEPELDVLLQRVAAGDHDSFPPVYDALSASVMGLACRILRDAAQAEEITQDVMVEVWRTARRFRPERGSAKAWVLMLAHRKAVDRVRTTQARGDRERLVALKEQGRPYDEPAEQAEQAEEQRQVRRCLESLSVQQREALILAFYGGLTYREVARTLAAPAGTVKSRLREGLHHLRDCLEALL
jgi:RNA polymerase sigma-70 factor (ECF subfamily)